MKFSKTLQISWISENCLTFLKIPTKIREIFEENHRFLKISAKFIRKACQGIYVYVNRRNEKWTLVVLKGLPRGFDMTGKQIVAMEEYAGSLNQHFSDCTR